MIELYFTVTAWIKIVASYLTLILWILLVISVVKVFSMLRHEKAHIAHELDEPHTEEEAKDMYTDDWRQIQQFVNSMQEAEWKLAVIQADKLVDEVLKVQGYSGESMGERMMSIDPNRFLTLQELWEAHKLRNQLVHDMGYQLNKRQAVAAVASYENFLKELGFFA